MVHTRLRTSPAAPRLRTALAARTTAGCYGLVPLIIALAAAAPVAVAAHDYDGDGIAEQPASGPWPGVVGDVDGDGDLDLGQAPSAGPSEPTDTSPHAVANEFAFNLVWDSGATLSNVVCVAVGDADLDGVLDIAGPHFAPNTLHVFRSEGNGDYTEYWSSAGTSVPGAYRAIAFGDTDGDGFGEILGGESSTLGKIMLFEETDSGFAFVHDSIRETDAQGIRRVRSVLIGDTDRDERLEVIVATGGSNPTAGLVAIWEHSGVAGDHTYTRVFSYTTMSYLFQAALGDSDNDGWPEILLGIGGLGANPLIIRRLEYDPALETWVHQSYTTAVIGLPLTPHVADLDGDGDWELAYGSTSGQGFVAIFESAQENTYTTRYVSEPALDGSVVALASGPLGDPAAPSLVAGSSEGVLGIWSYDAGRGGFSEVYLGKTLGGPIGELALTDDGGDGLQEVIPAVGGSRDQVLVLQRAAIIGLEDVGAPPLLEQPLIRVLSNPVAGFAELVVDDSIETLAIYDVHGRCVRRLTASPGQRGWDLRDDRGDKVRSGVYWIRIATSRTPLPGADRPARIVITR